MAKLTNDDVNDWKEATRKAGVLEETITQRIDYILRTIYKTFGKKFDYWYIPGEDASLRHYELEPENDFTGYCIEPYCSSLPIYSKVVDCEINLIDEGFPSRWLYEDFEEELTQGREYYKQWKTEKENKRKEKLVKSAEKKAATLKAIRQKLSPEELKLIKGLK